MLIPRSWWGMYTSGSYKMKSSYSYKLRTLHTGPSKCEVPYLYRSCSSLLWNLNNCVCSSQTKYSTEFKYLLHVQDQFFALSNFHLGDTLQEAQEEFSEVAVKVCDITIFFSCSALKHVLNALLARFAVWHVMELFQVQELIVWEAK